MRMKKVPLRKCVATQEMKPKKDMIRIVKNKEGEVFIDPTGKKNGRGAYLSLSVEAAEKAEDKHLLDQVLGVSLTSSFYEELKAYIAHQIARKSL